MKGVSGSADSMYWPDRPLPVLFQPDYRPALVTCRQAGSMAETPCFGKSTSFPDIAHRRKNLLQRSTISRA